MGAMIPDATGLHFHAGYLNFDMQTPVRLRALVFLLEYSCFGGIPGGSVLKNLPANAGDSGNSGLIPGSGRSLGVGNGNPL